MQQLLKDIELQKKLDEDGFVKLDNPSLDIDTIIKLKDFIISNNIRKKTNNGFDVSLEHENKDIVNKIIEEITNNVFPIINPILKDCEVFIASYLGKESDINSIVLPHQDWTFVENEEEAYSFSCWIPLVDVDYKNGCMGFIKKSHNIFNQKRASPAAKVDSPLSPHLYWLMQFIELVPMKAGEILLFNNKTLHASLPNMSGKYRDAIAIVLTKCNTNFRHYYLKPDTKDTLLEYDITVDFFTKYDDKILCKMYEVGKIISDYPLISEKKICPENYSREQLLDKMSSIEATYNRELHDYLNLLYKHEIKPSKVSETFRYLKKLLSIK